MKKLVLLFVIVIGFFQYSCSPKQVEKVSVKTLVQEIARYDGKLVEIEGAVVHLCGVDRRKIKLKSDDGFIIKVVPNDSTQVFEKLVNHKQLRVVGAVEEIRVERSLVDAYEKDKTLLCHVDHTPCKGSAWVQNKIESGVRDELSALDIKGLRDEMVEMDENYISVVTLKAISWELVSNDNTNK